MGHFERLFSKVVLLFMVLTLFTSCKEKPIKKKEPPKVEIQKSTEKQVLQKVKVYISQTKMSVPMQSFYNARERKRVPCTQYDTDTNVSCSSKSSASPYGYKYVTRNTRKCCRQKKVMVASLKGKWVTTYSDKSDQWKVELEFKDAAKQKNFLLWTVNDNNLQVKQPNK